MVRAALIVMLTALPAQGLTLGDLVGAWRGEGVWRAEGEPEQRLRCQLRGVARAGGGLALSGRCATARGGQSFAWGLRAEGGVVTAVNEAPQTDDSPPPAPVQGRIGPQGLHFDLPGGGRFDLAPEGAGLRLVLSGREGGRRVEALARLTRGG